MLLIETGTCVNSAEQLQNTRPLICISLNVKSTYRVMSLYSEKYLAVVKSFSSNNKFYMHTIMCTAYKYKNGHPINFIIPTPFSPGGKYVRVRVRVAASLAICRANLRAVPLSSVILPGPSS